MKQIYQYAGHDGSLTICTTMFFGIHWRINEVVDPFSITEYSEYITFNVPDYTYIYIKHCGITRVLQKDLVRDIISYNRILYILNPYGFFYTYNTDGYNTYNINTSKKQYADPLTYLVNYVYKYDKWYDPQLLDYGRKVFIQPYQVPRRIYSKKLSDISINSLS